MSMDRSSINCNLEVIKSTIGVNPHSNSNPNPNSNPSEQFDFDRTENDATHPILRGDHRHQGELVQCLTCRMQFKSFSFSDICAHYIFTHSNRNNCDFSNHLYKCLYCKRDVHYFLRAEKSDPEIYHFCSPRKQS
ncbi:uncharacterized protein LOC119557258 [Drosophila subpulchrella]|uniref:uncharacterized protein LOC119557258 n=1 Tax=Drosophila subpulchrella TaxID=1486046 RepID=UPI0018A17EED|nr:uncharacterized protein LOC119557258 [Drosophila subpulchrella]